MKLQLALNSYGRAGSLMLVIAAALVTGCVEHRHVYVHQEPAPVIVEPARPEPVPIPPPPVVVVAPAPVPPPAPAYTLRMGEELERMLAPIALYPDPLLAQLLPAATLPSQVVLANRYVREGGDLNQVDLQLWDRSIKALTRYPEVLSMLDNNLAWTTDVGLAFLNQPGDVMDAIQRLRNRAYALGNLQSCPEHVVYVENRIIVIVPARPAIIHIPVYVPEVVYVQRPPAPGRLYVSFGVGRPTGAWLNHDCDWQEHRVIVWHHDHPRPADWWARRPSEHRAEEVRNVTVWRARPIAEVAQAGGGDRGWRNPAKPSAPVQAEATPPPRQAPQPVAAHPSERVAPIQSPAEPARGGARPVPADATGRSTRPTVRPIPAPKDPNASPVSSGANPVPATASSRPVVTAPSTRPLPAPKEPNPVPVRSEVQPVPRDTKPTSTSADVRQAPAAKAPQPAPATVATRPVAAPKPQPTSPPARQQPLPVTKPAPASNSQGRPAGDALAGIESARDTRAASSRGQQSREVIAKPAPTARRATPPGQVKGSRAAEPKKNPNSPPN